MLQMMCTMYQRCKLVHADLSEYNILWHDNRAWFIDVSQAVEPIHPHALEFLYRDCTVTEFFKKRGVPDVMSASQLFLKVSGLDIPLCDDENEFLSKVCLLSAIYVLIWQLSQPDCAMSINLYKVVAL